MRRENPKLLESNVNTWLLADEKRKFMVRTLDDKATTPIARALLSDRYRRIDNVSVAMTVLPLFMGQEGIEVASCELTEGHLYLKIVNHRLETEVVPGDIVQAGIIVSNSEVGLGAVSVRPLLYRLVCTNGMVVNDLATRKMHMGKASNNIEGGPYLYSDEAMDAENKAFLLKLRDAAKVAINEAMFFGAVEKLKDSTKNKITGPVSKVVELVGKDYNITQPEGENVLEYLIRGGDMTQYGLGNAITRMSQDVDTYERATELESIGWQVATMGQANWWAVNNI